MLSADENTGSRAIVSKILLPILHHPFLYPTQSLPARQDDDNPSLPLSVHQSATISTNLEILQTLLTNADPSPSFITGLLTAILPPLYSIFSHLEATKTSDPALKESVQGLLSTWGRVVGASEGIEALWQIILGEGGDWKSDVAGNQKALKLLQDPLLPVRAHGLLLLRQLVSARQPKSPSRASGLEEPVIDRALVPAILSIFLQSVQDDDSYMYLNAVQGLAAMVDGFGRDVLKGLINTYTEGLEGLGGTGMTQQEVDVRTRVGEALGQVIRRCGEALPAYSNVLIPPLFQVMRTSHFPTALRVSAVSLLAQCAKTTSLAILPYAADLSEAMIDLVQVETVSATQRRKQTPVETVPDEGPTSGEEAEPPAPPTMDSQPTSTNAKFPPLRRAALHFLSLLIMACISRLYESADGEGLAFPQQLVRRAKTTLGYVAATDADAVVRVMARETLEALDQLAEALVGL